MVKVVIVMNVCSANYVVVVVVLMVMNGGSANCVVVVVMVMSAVVIVRSLISTLRLCYRGRNGGRRRTTICVTRGNKRSAICVTHRNKKKALSAPLSIPFFFFVSRFLSSLS